MRILTFTNLYPSSVQPRHGVFVEHRVRQLVASGKVSVRVVAPVPWVPRGRTWLGRHAVLANLPPRESRDGIEIWHPRFFAVPKLTSWFNPWSMALGSWWLMRRLRREQDFDLIDAHFVYPDGAAAILLGAWLGKPVVVTARGTDVNDFVRYRIPRAWIRWVTRRAAAMITVSEALRRRLLDLSVSPERVTVLRNGVDLDLFAPSDREAAQAALGARSPLLVSVGHLVPDKGHQLVIEALASLSGVTLMVVGDGPMRSELRTLAQQIGVEERVHWAGTISQRELAKYYVAADATVLASRSEGMPNVLLESLACGTPVIATDVGGNAEVVTAPVAGVLMKDRSSRAVVDAYTQLVRAGTDRDAVRAHAAQFSWAPITQGLCQVFDSAVRRASRGMRTRHGAAA